MNLNFDVGLSEKERLLSYGFQPHHLTELEDGSVVLDAEKLRMDYLLRRQGGCGA